MDINEKYYQQQIKNLESEIHLKDLEIEQSNEEKDDEKKTQEN